MKKKQIKEKSIRFQIMFVAALVIIIAASFIHLSGIFARSDISNKVIIPVAHRRSNPVCGLPGAGKVRCHAHVIVNETDTPLAGTVPLSGSLGPVQFHMAYNLPCTPGGLTASICTTPVSFGPQIIAIVDAYHTPTVEGDLATYSSYFGLPACTKSNGCLSVVNENGGSTLPTTVNNGWTLETALDVQTAHALCQTCKLLLVEANSSSITDLGKAVNTAVAMGATVVSNSYGAQEFLGETNYDSYYSHPGVAITVSAGDSGYGAEYPAAAKGVVAVGGTTLKMFSDYSYGGESVWSGSGSGCSRYETAPTWQTALSNWSLSGCGSKRGISDVAADADPNTGAAVYTVYNGVTGWYQVGGTSLAAPLIAGVYALQGNLLNSTTNAASVLYQNYSTSNFHDVLTGSNGNCSSIMCSASIGYDGPTGLGSPNGITGFGNATSTPAPVPTATPTPTPSSTDTIAPTVSITYPQNNAVINRNSWVTITASANDNVGVSKVDFTVDGTLICSDMTATYSCNWHVPNKRSATYTINAVAYDTAMNMANSTVTVSVK